MHFVTKIVKKLTLCLHLFSVTACRCLKGIQALVVLIQGLVNVDKAAFCGCPQSWPIKNEPHPQKDVPVSPGLPRLPRAPGAPGVPKAPDGPKAFKGL